ncbi:hypothetical protein GSI_15644 [Ganoderma sinense ZZ0214-1]|uniref:Uncharacterized protein n=1 Tax=Ganoderma sinense ZZ0214-1 TaxID=1077348 RepID=A0A2G8RNQ1_9APHY|nr:hypothetical protein GSI_15644 [Ganoderma sinense ZZ0214-1]
MSTPSHGGYRPAKLEPTPRYPHIILALNIVSITPPRFHWLIFVPAPGEDEDEVEVEVGTKVHAIRLFRRAFGSPNPAEIWRFEATTFTLSTSGSVVAAAIIGQLKDKTEKQLVDLLEEIPMDIPPWTETCLPQRRPLSSGMNA